MHLSNLINMEKLLSSYCKDWRIMIP